MVKKTFFKSERACYGKKKTKNGFCFLLIAFATVLVGILPTSTLYAVTRDFIFDFDGEIIHENVEIVYVKDVKVTEFTYDQTGLIPGERLSFGDHYGYNVSYHSSLDESDLGTLLTPVRVDGNVIEFSDYVTKEGIYRVGVTAFDRYNLRDSGLFYNLIQTTKSTVTVTNGIETETNKADVYVLNPSSIDVGRDITDTYGDYSYTWEIKDETGNVVLSGSNRNPTVAETASLPEGKYTISNTVSETIPPEFGTDLIQDTTYGAFEIITPKTTANKTVKDANDDGYASPKEELIYTITTKNTGSIVASEIDIQDTLINVLPYIENGATPGNIVVNITSDKDATKNTTVSATELMTGMKFDIVPDETVTITFNVVLKADLDVTTITSIVNQAVVDKTTLDAEIPTGDSKVTGSKVVNDTNNDTVASPSEELEYVITANNSGTVTANDVEIKDTLVNVLPYIENGATPGNIVVNITSDKDATKNTTVSATELMTGMKFDIVPDETVTITFNVVLKADLDVTAITRIVNQAVVDKTTLDAEIPIGDSKLVGSKKVSDQNNDGYASGNEILLYTLEFENTGLCKALNVVISDPLSAAGFKDAIISDLKINGVNNVGNIKEGINIGELDSGAKVVVTFNVKLSDSALKDSTELKNIASASDSTGKKIDVENTLKVQEIEKDPSKKEPEKTTENNDDINQKLPVTGEQTLEQTLEQTIVVSFLLFLSGIFLIKRKK